MNYRNVRDFALGLKTAGYGRGKAPLNSLLLAENIRANTGTAEPREGHRYYSSALEDEHGDPVTDTINAIYEYSREYWDTGNAKPAFYTEYVFAAGEHFYGWLGPPDDTAYLANELYPLGSDDVWVVIYRDWAYIADGVHGLHKYDGAHYFQVGIDPPPFTTAYVDRAPDTTGGRWIDGIGHRAYKLRYVRKVTYSSTDKVDYICSPFSDVAISPHFNLRKMNTIMTESSDPQVTHIELWCTEMYPTPADVRNKPFYLLKEVPNQTQGNWDGTSNVDIAKVEVGDNPDAEPAHRSEDTDEDWTHPPDGLTRLVFYKDRIYGVDLINNPSVLRYSKIGEPEQWPADNWLAIRQDDGDAITGIATRGQSLYIFKNRSIWVMTGDPMAVPILQFKTGGESTGSQTEIGLGCTSPRSLASWDASTLIFYSKTKGVYMVSGGELVQLSKDIDGITGLDDVAGAVWYDDTGEPFYILTALSGKAWICHLPTRTWVNDTNTQASCFCIDHNGYLLGGEGARINRFYHLGATDDNDAEIIHRLRTAWINLRDGMMHAVLRGVRFSADDLRDACTVEAYNQDGLQFTTTFNRTSDESVGIDGVAGRIFSIGLHWGLGKIESLTLYFLRRRGH